MLKKTFFAFLCGLLFLQQSLIIKAQEEMVEEESQPESLDQNFNGGDEIEYSANMEGFLNWICQHPTLSWRFKSDAKAALEFLHDEVLKEYTDLGNTQDAMAFQNLKASLSLLETCNYLRQENGLAPLKVSLQLMIISQKQLNFSDTQMDHSKGYKIAENLAWGYENPFEGWYFKEKPLYLEQGQSKEVKNYLNIINPKYRSMGAAHNNNSQYGLANESDGQVYSLQPGTMEVAELKSLVTQFEAVLPSSLPAPTYPLPDSEDKIALYRLYNTLSGEHFYTSNVEERRVLLASFVWKDEGQGWIAPKSSALVVYRLVNPNTQDHHYTLDENEYATLPKYGWQAEGLAFYSASENDEKAVALYRLYNPNATQVGMHHYTLDINERDTLVHLGWKDEGIAWYGFLD